MDATARRIGGAVTTPEEARALCAVNNACSISSTLTCVDADRSFSGSVAMNFLGDTIITRTRRLALVYERQVSHIACDGSDSVFIHFNAGSSPIGGWQMGRDWTLAPGEASLYVHNEATRLISQEGGDFLGIALPRKRTATWRIQPEDRIGQQLDVSSPAFRLIRHYLEVMSEGEGLEPALAAIARTHVADLAASWIGGQEDTVLESAGPRQTARLAAILTEMRRQYANPDLTAAHVGTVLGLSVRSVQQTLTEAGTSFSRRLAQIRAEAAHRRLISPHEQTQSVTAIAFDCGFRDLSDFYRIFRRHFDATPRDVRSAAKPSH